MRKTINKSTILMEIAATSDLILQYVAEDNKYELMKLSQYLVSELHPLVKDSYIENKY